MEIKQETLGYHMFSFWVVDENGEQCSIKMSIENVMQVCEDKRKDGKHYNVVGQLDF